jgi:hypothetical protein
MSKLLAAALFLSSLCAAAQQVPSGTVLPVSLNTTLDARRDQPGKPISGRVMQDVSLPDGGRIPAGARVSGHVVGARPASPGSPSQVTLRFDSLEYRGTRLSMTAHLRAVASMEQVFQSKLPTNAWDDYGTSPSDWNTLQIGGAEVYRGSGELISAGEVIGRAWDDGSVRAKLTPAPDRGCTGGSDLQEALWKFSPWACGAYGLGDLQVVRSEAARDAGEIVLESQQNVHVDGGSGWLLRLDRASNLP